MNCLRCNTPNEDGAKFCKNCGMDLTYNPSTTNSSAIDRQNLIYLLIVMSWEYFTWLIWFAIQKVIVPRFYSTDGVTNWDEANKLYKTLGWTVDIISILVLLVFSIIIKNRTARIFLIIFTVLRIAMLIGYRLFDQ